MTSVLCLVDDCGRPRRRRDWCGAHYQRWLKYGDARLGGRLRKQRDASCTVDECERPVIATGLCHRHYHRASRGIPLSGPPPRPSNAEKPCGVDGCERNQRARGWCDPHYKIWRKTGDPLRKPPRKQRSRGDAPGHLSSQGYRLLYRPDHPNARSDGRVQQHTVVMAEMLGRPLFPNEQVHHVNGIRSDNSPENLELWAKCQPCGQRVSDLVAFANSIIERYGSDPTAYP